MNKLFFLLFTLLTAVRSEAKITLPAFYGDNMVLQQQTQCRLWGKADARKAVSVITSWDNRHYNCKSDGQGHWQLCISTPKAGGPYTITISDGAKRMLSNILIGELWLCSGQSNMEMPMKGFKGQPVEGANEDIIDCRDASLRLFTVKRNAQLHPVDTVSGQWQEANISSVRPFSATAYYFGKALRQALNVPVGLIMTSWGGSACEAWMKREWLKEDWLKAYPQIKNAITQENVDQLQQRCPSALYNGMLHPLIGLSLRGVIWYQGEDNVNRYATYADQLSTLIEGWRKEWGLGDLPFYYCQIAPYDYSLIHWKANSALLREQQALVEKKVKNARMAVLLDVGLQYGIHPRKKRMAGERLALLALGNIYKMKGLPDFATFGSVTFRNDTAVVAFDRSKEWIYFQNGISSDNFEIAGADSIFHPAKAWIARNRVYLRSEAVKKPVAVRYAFHNWVVGDLMHDGLPVGSFRTDNWNEKTIR